MHHVARQVAALRRELPESDPVWWIALSYEVRALAYAGSPVADAAARLATIPASVLDSAEGATAALATVSVLFVTGNEGPASALATRIETSFGRRSDPAVPYDRAQLSLHWAREAGDLGAVVQTLREHLVYLETVQDPRRTSQLLVLLGMAEHELGAADAAAATLGRACEVCRKARDAGGALVAQIGLGRIAAETGRVVTAVDSLEEALGHAQRLEAGRFVEHLARVALAVAYGRAGRHADATRLVAPVIAAKAPEDPRRLDALAIRVRAAVHAGAPEDGAREAAEALAAVGARYPSGEMALRHAHFEALEAAGDATAAEEARQEGEARLWARLAKISDPSLRETHLRGIEAHRFFAAVML